MLDTMSNDVFMIAEGVVVLLDLVTIGLMIAVVYLATVGLALNRPSQIGAHGTIAGRIATFVTVCVITLAVTHAVLMTRLLLPAIAWFAVATAASIVVYWRQVRAINRPEDMRIPYTIMVLGAACLLTLGALTMLYLARERVRLEADAKLSIDTLAQIATIAVTAVSVVFTYILKSDQSNRTAKQHIYQSLELQSIDLFRFESGNTDLVRALWNADQPPDNDTEHYQLKQYVCQMLNLFEMAYRFRVDGTMAPTVFGSWVIWIWELCNTPVFQALWADEEDGLPLNYVPEFRGAVDLAVDIATKPEPMDAAARRTEFFNKLARRIGCDEVERWLDRHAPGDRKL